MYYSPQIQSAFTVVVIFNVGGRCDSRCILNRQPKCFSLASIGVIFFVCLTKHYLSSLRNPEAYCIDWTDSSGAQTVSEFRMASAIAHSERPCQMCEEEASFKKFLRLLSLPPRRQRLFSLPHERCLLGRWLMRVWQVPQGHLVWLLAHKNVWQGGSLRVWSADGEPNWPPGSSQ